MLVVLRVKRISPISMGDFHLFWGLNQHMRKLPLFLSFFLCFHLLNAQTLGGSAIYNFLKLSPSPQLSAVGGINVSLISQDASLTWNNPAQLRPSMHKQLGVNFTSFYAGIQNGHVQAAWHEASIKTNFAIGVHYLHYGETAQTDVAGNIQGTFRPFDYAVQASMSKEYIRNWHFGATLKYLQSTYGIYRSTGIALDMGLNYYDSTNGWQLGFLAKNMGTQLKTYAAIGEDLPFDLQLGVTRRIMNSPFQFSFTAQRLHQFDLIYTDTIYNASQGIDRDLDTWTNNLFRHFVFAAQIFPSEKIECSIGYNILRRAELIHLNQANGLTGLSFGLGVHLKKMQIRYARSHYQSTSGFNQFGLNISL